MKKPRAVPATATAPRRRIGVRLPRRRIRATTQPSYPDALSPEGGTPYRVVVQNLTEVVCRFKADGTLTFVNDIFCRFFGKSRTELMGAPWQPVAAPEDLPAIEARLRTLSPDNPVVVVVNRVHSASGDVRWMQFVNRAFFDSAGQLVEVQSVGRDVTEERQAQDLAQRLSQEVIAAREEERMQVSAALHHNVGSMVVGVSAYFGAVEAAIVSGDPGRALAALHRTRTLFEQSVAQLKELAGLLRPPELDVLGLRAALRQHFAWTTTSSRTRIRFTDALGRTPVPAATATTLFRVVQEALNNAIMHGHATEVNVSLGASKGAITMTVQDHGEGFEPSDPPAPTSRMGLRLMAEMVGAAGGTLAVTSKPGHGTRVRAVLPRDPTGRRT